jgi:benzoyl-CoA reductase subunit B
MSEATAGTGDFRFRHQGNGRNLQKDLLGAWYHGLSTANAEGRPVAFTFVPGNVAELLRAFDFEIAYPEVNALQCGVRKTSGEYILAAEEEGYSPDVCGYVKNDVGMWVKGNIGPSGPLPKPDLLLLSYTGCTTFVKWFEALAKYTGAEIAFLDVPYVQGSGIRPADLAYVARQLEELVPVLERVSGKRFDAGKLRAGLANAREAEDLWVKVLESARAKPSPIDAYFEAVFFMAPIYVLRGTPGCVGYYEAVLDEVRERTEHGIGPVPEERFRVVVEGPPPWPHFRAFWELFKRWGVTAVASTYSKVGGYYDAGFRHDPDRPFESLAEYCLLCYTNQDLARRGRMIADYARDYEADAIVIHSVKSCRSFSVGQADLREHFTKDLGIPTLFVESDLADPRYFQEAQLRNRIDAFFESLEHRRLVGVGEEAR